MTPRTLKEAVDQARRFIELAKKAEARDDRISGPSRHNAAIKRASLDLTRALADMRKP